MEQEIKQTLKMLNLIFFGIIGSLSLFFASIIILNYETIMASQSSCPLQTWIAYIAPGSLIISVFGGYFIYQTKSKKTKSINDQSEKLRQYRITKMIEWGIYEAGGIISLVMIFINYQRQYLYMFLIVLIILFMSLPSSKKMNTDFGIKIKDNENEE